MRSVFVYQWLWTGDGGQDKQTLSFVCCCNSWHTCSSGGDTRRPVVAPGSTQLMYLNNKHSTLFSTHCLHFSLNDQHGWQTDRHTEKWSSYDRMLFFFLLSCYFLNVMSFWFYFGTLCLSCVFGYVRSVSASSPCSVLILTDTGHKTQDEFRYSLGSVSASRWGQFFIFACSTTTSPLPIFFLSCFNTAVIFCVSR